MASLLIVEDDESIGSGLSRTLTAEGHDTTWVTTIAAARATSTRPEVVVLDLNLPDGDGLMLCGELLQRHPDARVIMLTARTGELDAVLGLNAGAVDYVAKPFRLAELLARVNAQLRTLPTDSRDGTEHPIAIGDLRIDLGARRVSVAGTPVALRVKEFDLLARLAKEPGIVVRREQLMSDVWDEHWWGSTKTLDTHMAALRRHLGEQPGCRSRITTVRGVGYRLEP